MKLKNYSKPLQFSIFKMYSDAEKLLKDKHSSRDKKGGKVFT